MIGKNWKIDQNEVKEEMKDKENLFSTFISDNKMFK